MIYKENGEGCESKKCKLLGERAYAHAREKENFTSFKYTATPPQSPFLKHPVMKGNRSKEKGTQMFQPGKPHLNKLLLTKTSNLLVSKVFPELS